MRFAVSRDVLGAFTVVVFSAVGALWSVVLLLLARRVAATCGLVIDGGCGPVLHGEALTIAGAPLFRLGAAHFTGSLLLAAAILVDPARVAPAGRQVVLTLAWIGAAVSLVLVVDAQLVLGLWCDLLAVWHVACLGLFLGAWILMGADGTPLGVFQRARVDRPTVAVGLAVACVFAATWLALGGISREAAGQVQESCGEGRGP